MEHDRELETWCLDMQEQLSDSAALDTLLDVFHLDERQPIQPVDVFDHTALKLLQEL